LEVVKWMGRRVRGVSTSLISSVSLARNHWSQWGPDTAERKVRGEPDGFRFRRGAEEEATEEEGERGYGENHLAVKGLGGGKGGR
jgi:hypothetical protein